MIRFGENQKTLFLGQKCPILAQNGQKNFFRKIGLRHVLSWMILRLHAKNQKIPMIQFREKRVTNERMYIHTFSKGGKMLNAIKKIGVGTPDA